MIKLETEHDKHKELLVVARLFSSDQAVTWIPCAEYASVDYVGVRDNRICKVAEIKTRKKTMQEVMQYPGGLLLKRRKFEEVAQVEALLNVPAYVFFGFDNGMGDIVACRPATLDPRQDHDLGRRDRDLETDLEPVVLLNWDYDLIRWLDPAVSP